jgi:hypothetical protein
MRGNSNNSTNRSEVHSGIVIPTMSTFICIAELISESWAERYDATYFHSSIC